MAAHRPLFEFLQQLCHREPGVVLPNVCEKDWEPLVSRMKTSPEELGRLLMAIWKGFYREVALEADLHERLLELSPLNHVAHYDNSDEDAVQILLLAQLALGYDLARQQRYKSALTVLEPLKDTALFKDHMGWANHLNQKVVFLKAISRVSLSPVGKKQLLWEVIGSSKLAFDDIGQWRASIWQEVQGVEVLAAFGTEKELQWLTKSLEEQARYYQWDELGAYLQAVLMEQKKQMISSLSVEMTDPDMSRLRSMLSLLREEGAVESFIGLSKALSEQLEKLGRFQEANEILKGWLDIYQDGGVQ